jgi:flagellar biosynthesis/type III secretory pathway M-ring protein FliF/YscJ
MAIFTSVILLAQNASSTINENLQATEGKLQNANQELDLLKEQYNNMLTQTPDNSFFNFSNMYFWCVLVGLLLLAFGLLFLLAELQNKDKKVKHKNKEEKIEPAKNEPAKGGPASGGEDDADEEVAEEEPELAKESEAEKIEEELVEEDEEDEEEKPAKKMDKPIKIKVEKVK